jgi:hypothetical protein
MFGIDSYMLGFFIVELIMPPEWILLAAINHSF